MDSVPAPKPQAASDYVGASLNFLLARRTSLREVVPLHPKTWLGNRLAFMSFVIFLTAVRCGAPAMLQNPRLSKMAWTRGWRYLRSFQLLLFALDPALVYRKCPGCASHVPIEGQLSQLMKKTAVHVPRLPSGLENLFVNDLLAAKKWTTWSSWKWRSLLT